MAKLGFDLTFENIERLADLVNEKELSEITLEEESGVKLTLKGKKCPPPPPVGAPMMPPAMASAPVPQQAEPSAPVPSGKAVKAPIVGTFYSAPSPDSKPFVSVGDTIHKGDTIFIIESMKVMSEVQSELDGVVREICVSNGDPVEFDQTIMILD